MYEYRVFCQGNLFLNVILISGVSTGQTLLRAFNAMPKQTNEKKKRGTGKRIKSTAKSGLCVYTEL